MPTRIEVNCLTGETREIPLTQEELDELASQEPVVMYAAPIIDPVEKLKSFLASNPDVAELLK